MTNAYHAPPLSASSGSAAGTGKRIRKKESSRRRKRTTKALAVAAAENLPGIDSKHVIDFSELERGRRILFCSLFVVLSCFP